MPSLKHPLPVELDDIWHQNEAEIRRLYQERRLTLKKVKQIMEAKGFPKNPLSTWETKLRDELGLRKKARTNDWPLIYRHVLPRLEHPKKKKPTRPTAIYINGTAFAWDKAWKEMRRSGALVRPLYQGPLSPLPGYITVRSPSPFQLCLPASSPQSVNRRSPSPFQLEHLDSQPTGTASGFEQLDSAIVAPTSAISSKSCSNATRCLEMFQGLQLTQKLKDLPTLEHCSLPRNFNSVDDVNLPLHLVPLVMMQDSELQSDLTASSLMTGLASTALTVDFDPYHYLSIAVYLLSNKLTDLDDTSFSEWLEAFSRSIPQNLLAEVLQIDLPGVRAAWELLISAKEMRRHKDMFRLLVDVGIRKKWLAVEAMGHDYLYYAARANCGDVIKKLLRQGCRPDSGWLRECKSAILRTIENGAFESTRILLEHCDVNKEFHLPSKPGTVGYCTNFQLFIHHLTSSNERHLRGLDMFLKHGANIDAPHIDSCFEPRHDLKMVEFYKTNKIPTAQWPTVLDHYFLVDPIIFEKLVPFSNSKSMRSTILHTLEQTNGVSRLLALLPTTQMSYRELQRFLQLLLAEQLLIGTDRLSTKGTEAWNRKTNVKLIRRLLEFGTNHDLPALHVDATDLVCAAIQHIHKGDATEVEMATTLQLLGEEGKRPIDGARILRAAVQKQDTSLLKYFVGRATNVTMDGTEALAEAARLDNFEAVRLLLDSGVDVRISFPDDRADAPSSTPKKLGKGAGKDLSPNMVKFLVERGVAIGGTDPIPAHPFQSLLKLFEEGSCNIYSQTVQLVDKLSGFKNGTDSYNSALLLEKCLRGPTAWDGRAERLKIFEHLFRQGAQLSPGSPLAVFIYAGGRKTLVEEILASGADINSYSRDFSSEYPEMTEPWCLTPLQAAASCGNEELISQLINRGADVNAPAVGRWGKTALQQICAWRPSTRNERTRKMRIIQTLLNSGAEGNDTAADWCGRTALQITATEGELDVAILLLCHGADVNAPPSRQGWVALDGAAYWGRLNMVQLLLDAGAISGNCVSTKYDGAMALAKIQGHFAVADLIRDHATKVGTANVA